MELIIHPRAAKDAREIAAKYRAISEKLYERFWDELDPIRKAILAERFSKFWFGVQFAERAERVRRGIKHSLTSPMA